MKSVGLGVGVLKLVGFGVGIWQVHGLSLGDGTSVFVGLDVVGTSRKDGLRKLVEFAKAMEGLDRASDWKLVNFQFPQSAYSGFWVSSDFTREQEGYA